VGAQALNDLADEYGLDISLDFDVSQPEVYRFLEASAQRFAQEVNATTWDALKKSLGEALAAGETLPDFEKRVEDVMGDRIRSSARTIAQTEVGRAANGGTLLAWGNAEDQGVKLEKGWLAAFVNTRESHADAHKRYSQNPIPITDNFVVGNGAGPAPGQIGVAEEDINCQCTMYARVVES
jgi:hypothetical protein